MAPSITWAGPRTLKHGLLAREVVISAGRGQENRTEFPNGIGSACAGPATGRCPRAYVGGTHAACYWRLMRAVRAEAGEILRRLED